MFSAFVKRVCKAKSLRFYKIVNCEGKKSCVKNTKSAILLSCDILEQVSSAEHEAARERAKSDVAAWTSTRFPAPEVSFPPIPNPIYIYIYI